MRDSKESILQGMFSRKDPIESIRKKQDRFSESMENLRDDRKIKDYSVNKSDLTKKETENKKVSF
jgi:hypothetical protein